MNVPRTIILFSCLFLAAIGASAQDAPGGKLTGLVFGDYFYKIHGDSSGGGSQYSSLRKDQEAFQFRRFYLFYDYTMSETFAGQLLLEGNDKALTDGKHGVFVKTAYVEWKNIFPMTNLWFGLIPTPTWLLLSEKVWSYRAIEKTIADFRSLGVATDMGVGLRGKFSEDGTVSYVAMIGNGGGQKPETNKYKKYYGSLAYKPVPEFVLEAYGDVEPNADDRTTSTLKGFAAYQTESATIGVEVVQQTQRKAGVAGADRAPFGIAVFARAPLSEADHLSAFARYDHYDPDTKASSAGFTENFFTAGLDYAPIKNVHIMPNIWVDTFSDKSPAGLTQDADIVGRATFYLVFK